MGIDEIERRITEQHSARHAFPSQAPTLDQMFSGQNQRSAIEMQIESAKLSAAHDKKLEKMSHLLGALLDWAEQHQMALRERDEIEERRYKENTRLSRIAAWSSVASIVVTVILTAIGIWVQIARK